MQRAGYQGLPIVSLISFLMGLITAFQAAVQLRQFGADIYVANLVGLSITRELGPLMTAIIAVLAVGVLFATGVIDPTRFGFGSSSAGMDTRGPATVIRASVPT